MNVVTIASSDNFDQFKSALKSGAVCFTFVKRNCDVERRYGTVSPDLIPPAPVTESAKPKRQLKVNPNIQRWYDLQKKAWRSLDKANLVDWVACDANDIPVYDEAKQKLG